MWEQFTNIFDNLSTLGKKLKDEAMKAIVLARNKIDDLFPISYTQEQIVAAEAQSDADAENNTQEAQEMLAGDQSDVDAEDREWLSPEKEEEESENPEQVFEEGFLSAQFESNGDPAAIGYDVNGGWSYGTHQIATKPGSMKEFLDVLKDEDPDLYQKLLDGGGNNGAINGTDKFKNAWKEASKNPNFAKIQRKYIDTENKKGKIEIRRLGLDASKYSPEFNEMIFSVVVQHGPTGSKNLIKVALQGKNIGDLSEIEMIKLIYNERMNVNRWFSKSEQKIQISILERFKREKKILLEYLEKKGK